MKCREKLGFQKEKLGSGQGQGSCHLEAGARGAKASSQERLGSWPERLHLGHSSPHAELRMSTFPDSVDELDYTGL